MAARNSFSFFVSYIEAIEELPEKEQLAVLKAIIKYALYDEEPNGFKGIKQAVFLLVKPTLDKSKQKSANGKQGGSKTKAKRKQNESKPEANEECASLLPSIGEGIGIGVGIGVGEREGEKSAHTEGSLFTSFWNAYPEHARGDREAAWEAWKKLSMTDDKAKQVLTYLDLWKASQRWTSDGGAFIPAAKNFLTPEKSYMRTKPAPAKKQECNWTPGKRELDADDIEAIRRMMAEPDIPDEYEREGDENGDI